MLSTPENVSAERRKYEEMDLDELFSNLTTEEVALLAQQVDPDDSLIPPDQRTSYKCERTATGPLDRERLIKHIQQQSENEPDRPELVPYKPGVIRGKKWVSPAKHTTLHKSVEEEAELDLGDEFESVLNDATDGELVDLAAILGFHSMMNQDQYHASQEGKKVSGEVGWSGVTRATCPKVLPTEPPNSTDPEDSITRLSRNDADLKSLNFNNIKTISDDQLKRLFEAVSGNPHLECLSMSNTALSDSHIPPLLHAIENNSALREISVESNFISPKMIAAIIKSLLKKKTVETFRAANQRCQILGNKIETQITEYVEQNPTLLQLGLHFEYNDARARVASHLQQNRDKLRLYRKEKST